MDSAFRYTYAIEALKQFDWDRIMLELQQNLPTLIQLLECLVPSPSQHKSLLCLIASQLLKARHGWLGLVQRAVSIMLYGHGTNKQVLVFKM